MQLTRTVLTVDFPEGIRVNVEPGFCTMPIPKNDDLEVLLVTCRNLVGQPKNKRTSIVVMRHIESGQKVWLPYDKVAKMKEEGSLRS